MSLNSPCVDPVWLQSRLYLCTLYTDHSSNRQHLLHIVKDYKGTARVVYCIVVFLQPQASPIVVSFDNCYIACCCIGALQPLDMSAVLRGREALLKIQLTHTSDGGSILTATVPQFLAGKSSIRSLHHVPSLHLLMQ